MELIFTSLSDRFTNYDIGNFSGVTAFVSHERLVGLSIAEAVALKSTEQIVGLKISANGIRVCIQNK